MNIGDWQDLAAKHLRSTGFVPVSWHRPGSTAKSPVCIDSTCTKCGYKIIIQAKTPLNKECWFVCTGLNPKDFLRCESPKSAYVAADLAISGSHGGHFNRFDKYCLENTTFQNTKRWLGALLCNRLPVKYFRPV